MCACADQKSAQHWSDVCLRPARRVRVMQGANHHRPASAEAGGRGGRPCLPVGFELVAQGSPLWGCAPWSRPPTAPGTGAQCPTAAHPPRPPPARGCVSGSAHMRASEVLFVGECLCVCVYVCMFVWVCGCVMVLFISQCVRGCTRVRSHVCGCAALAAWSWQGPTTAHPLSWQASTFADTCHSPRPSPPCTHTRAHTYSQACACAQLELKHTHSNAMQYILNTHTHTHTHTHHIKPRPPGHPPARAPSPPASPRSHPGRRRARAPTRQGRRPGRGRRENFDPVETKRTAQPSSATPRLRHRCSQAECRPITPLPGIAHLLLPPATYSPEQFPP
jgi:hypothetical protein